jgi:hypothetical protein
MNKLIHNKNVIKVILVIACIALTAISCGVTAALPTIAPTAKVGHVTATVPVVSANVESINTDAHVYITTAPLHIRSCAGIDCAVLAYLAAGASVDVIAAGISGPGCAGASWYAVQAGGVAGFVCSLYVEVR